LIWRDNSSKTISNWRLLMKKYQKPVIVKLGSVMLIKGSKNVKSDFTSIGFL